MQEPKRSQVVLDRMKKVQQEAEKNSHVLSEWKWDDHGCWRCGCKKRNCTILIWVATDGSSGGRGIEETCWMEANFPGR